MPHNTIRSLDACVRIVVVNGTRACSNTYAVRYFAIICAHVVWIYISYTLNLYINVPSDGRNWRMQFEYTVYTRKIDILPTFYLSLSVCARLFAARAWRNVNEIANESFRWLDRTTFPNKIKYDLRIVWNYRLRFRFCFVLILFCFCSIQIVITTTCICSSGGGNNSKYE